MMNFCNIVYIFRDISFNSFFHYTHFNIFISIVNNQFCE